MIYERMSYLVRHGKQSSTEFKSLVGVLTGDSASPGLWNFYFDWVVPDDVDDIVLNGRRISHVAQADDVAIWSTSPEGAQRKVDLFMLWCSVNFMVIAALKCSYMIYGMLPSPVPKIHIGDHSVELVDCYKYVGVWFRSTHRNIFADHYTIKASKAINMAHAIFAIEKRVGALPVFEGRQLYMARFDPHLISGCEVSIDVDSSLLGELEDAQHSFLRRLLGVNRRGMLCPLFTETGVLPIKFRRIILALTYARYLVNLPGRRFARAAFLDSVSLAASGTPCWLGDLRLALTSLPTPVSLPDERLTVLGIESAVEEVEKSGARWLQDCLWNSPKPWLLHSRLEKAADGTFVGVPLKLRHYLLVPITRHRKALTRLLTGDSPLAIERGRWPERDRMRIPREWRLCRFCRTEVEDECHALLECAANAALVNVRRGFVMDVQRIAPAWAAANDGLPLADLLIGLTRERTLTKRLGMFVWDVYEVFATTIMYVPPQFRRPR
ncbi:hypothetical protein PLICRDRAFT_36277 [Plicaturopsis crispa FD-325 SS-3]|nr:hypothetical protein PLICRDRAFT_36277 [Plicaturopsis crispa FD-325 SS-3]